MSALLNNRYRILQTLGSGGCGKTFLAEDAHMPSKRRCVIKQLKPATDDPITHQIIQERFQREAATLEMLGVSSDQIPTLYAYFTETEEFYLVQDWIEGKNLMQKVREEGVFSEGQVKDIMVNLLPVIDYIHSQGIIHRDIKPENIMIRKHDGKPVLIDFGAVKEVVATIIDLDGYPTSSIVIGSPGYMPLEQAAGKPLFASDLYSLGLTVIYLLTGKRPKELTDLLTGEISWRKYAANVSPELATILDKAIKPLARERYRTAREMLEALQSIDSHSDLTIPTKRAPPRVNIPTLSSKLTIQNSVTWIRTLIWGGVGFISGLTSILIFDLPWESHPNISFVLLQSPGLIFGFVLYLFGEYSSSPPIGKRKRVFSYIVLTIASILGWYCAITDITKDITKQVVAIVSDNLDFGVAFTFFMAGLIGSIFIILAEMLCWRLEFRKWIYSIIIVTVAGLSGFIVSYIGIYMYELAAFGMVYIFVAIWEAVVLAAHVIALKVTRERPREAI